MGVLLYSKFSYVALGKNSLFVSLCQSHSIEPAEYAEDLFGLNVEAFKIKYELEDDASEIEEERNNQNVDSEFSSALEKNTKTSLYRLFQNIDYQISDFYYSGKLEEVNDQLHWLISSLADSICDELDSVQGEAA